MNSPKTRHTLRLAVVGISAAVISLLAASPHQTEAYALNYGGEVDQTVCLDPHGIAYVNLFSGKGPADKTWVLQNMVGLSNGDNVQDAYFQFDLDVGGPGAKFHGAARYWMVVGLSRPYKGTTTAHAGGLMDLDLVIDNVDAQAACYAVYSLALYKS